MATGVQNAANVMNAKRSTAPWTPAAAIRAEERGRRAEEGIRRTEEQGRKKATEADDAVRSERGSGVAVGRGGKCNERSHAD